MNKLWTNHEQVVNEHVQNKSIGSPKQVKSKLWKTHEQIVNKLLTVFKLWKHYEQTMNKLWIIWLGQLFWSWGWGWTWKSDQINVGQKKSSKKKSGQNINFPTYCQAHLLPKKIIRLKQFLIRIILSPWRF